MKHAQAHEPSPTNMQSLAATPAGATVWLTFAGGGDDQQLLENWVAHVRELEVPHLVVRTAQRIPDALLPACL
jgi:hypothetical protein